MVLWDDGRRHAVGDVLGGDEIVGLQSWPADCGNGSKLNAATLYTLRDCPGVFTFFCYES